MYFLKGNKDNRKVTTAKHSVKYLNTKIHLNITQKDKNKEKGRFVDRE